MRNSPSPAKREHPDAIFVQLTTRCNARCVSCPHPFTYGVDGDHEKGVMGPHVWDELISQISRDGFAGQVGMYLHHEPLLIRDLAQKIKDVNRKTRAFVVLSTNGALLTERRRAELIDARPRTVHINISSAAPDQYAEIMKLDWEKTRQHAHAFIEECPGDIQIEINCPVLEGVDTQLLRDEFPGTKVNIDYWANSRGGLLDDVSAESKGSRFKTLGYCKQPRQNLNVLWDGSVILCCMDWAHETKSDFPKITEANAFDTYNGTLMSRMRNDFKRGRYDRYRMCGKCADELGFYRGKHLSPVFSLLEAGGAVYRRVKTALRSVCVADDHSRNR